MRYWSSALALVFCLLPSPLCARHLVVGLGIPQEHGLWPKLQSFMTQLALKTEKDLVIELKSTPYPRIQEQVSKGEMDGDVGRLQEVYEGNAGVVRVDEVASTLRLFFIFHKDRVMTDLSAIRRFKTLAARESFFHRRACKELQLDCEFVGPGSSTMDMLRLKRVGAVMTTQFQLVEHMRLAGNPSLFRVGEKAWYMEPAYLFLAKKNADLAPGIAAALRELKQDGTYKKVFGMDP
ncbi:MAG TPA: hypothetical protein VFO10_03060 [Oligoflexus sp.]|uniref:hypothetical protein n=1 Tax=Oligoflexus sp. TaxID=1971216 RepID=UPI002D7F59CA|nr:hypothetical protein [Oligoflexus sp.]HET9236203.1 hypothetical protein [Oligoflexus sp.]